MSRIALIFMFLTLSLSAQAALTVLPDTGYTSCQVLADDAKQDKKKGEGEQSEEEEPDCD